jgi:hypothetical protein
MTPAEAYTQMPVGQPMRRQTLREVMEALAVQDREHPALLQYTNLVRAARARADIINEFVMTLGAILQGLDLTDPETWTHGDPHLVSPPTPERPDEPQRSG